LDPVALVTGASSGLGRGLALTLARQGYAVGVASRRTDLLNSLAREILDEGGRVAVLPCDVSDRARCQRAVAECSDELGPIDLLVANAGIKEHRTEKHVDAETVERVMRVNFFGAVYFTEAVLPSMLERGAGQIVCVSSVAGYGGLPGAAAYSASKGAMTNYFEGLRIELEPVGVDVTVLCPGFVRTPMTEATADARPFVLECDEAVERMTAAILNRKRAHTFPWQPALAARFGRLLPRAVYDRLLTGRR
jgi:short-subunit dehydrogenase